MAVEKVLPNPYDPTGGTNYQAGIVVITSIVIEDVAKSITLTYVCYANAEARVARIPFRAGEVTICNSEKAISNGDGGELEMVVDPAFDVLSTTPLSVLPKLTLNSTVRDVIKTACYVALVQHPDFVDGKQV